MDQVYERFSLMATVDPVSQGVGSADTDVIEMGPDDVVVFVLLTGVLGAAATVDFSVFASATSGGSYAQVTGTACTQLVKASHDASQEILVMRGRDLPTGKTFVKARATVAAAASLIAVVALRFKEGYAPANANDLATVVQRKISS